MDFFLKIAAYIFHPLLMPLLGVFLYFGISPRFIELEIMQARLIAVLIITVFIPIITFFLLKNIGILSSIHLERVEDRKVPLMIHCVLLLLIIKMVFEPYENPELYYFFVGILFSTLTALILVFLKFKVSLHQLGVAGLTMFLIALGIHFKVNVLLAVSLFFIANGWVATSRLHTNSHSEVELIVGWFIGVLPQIIMINFWL
jgi:hypothetical protein